MSMALDVTDRIFAVLCFTKIAKRRITHTTIFDNTRTYFADVGETTQWSHAWRGPSAIAELLVYTNWVAYLVVVIIRLFGPYYINEP